MNQPRTHIEDIRQRRQESHDDVLDSLAGAIDRLEKAFPGQWHFLMEFIQNADDANSKSLSIDISRDEIRIQNDGNTFDYDDVESICKVGRSSKKYTEKGEDYIGYLGVGFKSVFLISHNPQIYSGDYRFEFDKNIWEQPDETPWQIYPLWIKHESKNIVKDGYTTGFRIPLSESVDDEMFGKLIDEVSAEQVSDRTLLFLRNLEEIEIIDRVRGVTKKITKTETSNTTEYETYNFEIYEDGELVETNKWLVFRSTSKIPEEIKGHHLTQSWERDDLETREVMVGFRFDEDYELTKEEGTAHMGVFSFLPLKEVPSGLNFLVQADFLTAPGRETIHREAPWNEWLAEQVYNLLIDHVIPVFKENDRWKYGFTDILHPGDGGHEIFDDQIHQPLQEHLRTNSVLLDRQESFIKPEDGVKINSKVDDLVNSSDIETLYPDKRILNQNCVAPWQLTRLVEDGPDFNSEGLKNRMGELLDLKAKQVDIGFFIEFYSELDEYADATLSGSSITNQDIVLTQENGLKRPKNVFFPDQDVDIPPELAERFFLVHDELLRDETTRILGRLGVESITQDRIQKALNREEIPEIRENWDSFTDRQKIDKTELCMDLWSDNQVTAGELEFISVKSQNGEWLSPEDIVFPNAYLPNHSIEEISMEGLLSMNLKFLSDEYLPDAKEETVNVWRQFFEALGAENNLKKSNVSEQVAVETALKFEKENDRSPEALPRHEEMGGYDIKSESEHGERLIEAKGRQNASPQISLTPTQYEHLQNEGDNYYIYVVRDTLKNPTLSVIKGKSIYSVEKSIRIDFNEWHDLGSQEYRPINRSKKN